MRMFWEEVQELHRIDPAGRTCCDLASPPATHWMGLMNMVHNMLVEIDHSHRYLGTHSGVATV